MSSRRHDDDDSSADTSSDDDSSSSSSYSNDDPAWMKKFTQASTNFSTDQEACKTSAREDINNGDSISNFDPDWMGKFKKTNISDASSSDNKQDDKKAKRISKGAERRERIRQNLSRLKTSQERPQRRGGDNRPILNGKVKGGEKKSVVVLKTPKDDDRTESLKRSKNVAVNPIEPAAAHNQSTVKNDIKTPKNNKNNTNTKTKTNTNTNTNTNINQNNNIIITSKQSYPTQQ
ncbi:MAG: hypothetical protein ACI90V_002850, partial [Bacillariaceae sp.]